MITFSIDDIIKYCGKSSYEKGRSCASPDDFIKVFTQVNVLSGLYQGSVGVYRVTVHFKNNVPDYSWCTCPAMSQYDGRCKHIAGLMILWNKSPRKFMILEPWQSLLENKNKEELFQIIVNAASKSIDMTTVLYEEIKGESFIDDEELYGFFD